MTTTAHGIPRHEPPLYEATGAYRPDVLAQIEGTEPQWSDAPAECKSPEPDLSGTPLPSLHDFAWALAQEIGADEPYTNSGRALRHAANVIALDVFDVRFSDAADDFLQLLQRSEWRHSRNAWRTLRELRIVQLGGYDALHRYREERS